MLYYLLNYIQQIIYFDLELERNIRPVLDPLMDPNPLDKVSLTSVPQ